MSAMFVLLILILISALPVFAVFLWFRLAKYRFTYRWFLFALLAGAAAFFPALFMQNFLNFDGAAAGSGRLQLFYQFFIRIAFTEELSRFLMLLLFFGLSCLFSRTLDTHTEGALNSAEDAASAGANADTNQPIENALSLNAASKGAAAGLVAGLGFAVLETAVYGASDSGILLIRAVTAAPLHAACGSRVGIAAASIRANPIQSLLRLFSAAAIHGVYNLMIIMPGFPSIMAVLIALTTLASSVITIKGSVNK